MGILDEKVSAFIGLGGNFIRAVPETVAMEQAWRKLPLTVQILTKLNRSAVVHGREAFLLPCLGRIEIDRQASGKQFVTVEDTTGRFHASHGQVEPAGPNILSEPKIVAALAKATLPEQQSRRLGSLERQLRAGSRCHRRDLSRHLCRFQCENRCPKGFDRPLPARQRIWKTKNGKANFIVPTCLSEDPDLPQRREGVLTLITVRSNDQFNTTIYSYEDRLRGIYGTRKVVLMHESRHAQGLASRRRDRGPYW